MCRSDRKWLSYISRLLSCSVSSHCPADDWQLCNHLQAGFSGSTSFSLINYWRHFSLLRTAAACWVTIHYAYICVSLEQQRSCTVNRESVITCTHKRRWRKVTWKNGSSVCKRPGAALLLPVRSQHTVFRNQPIAYKRGSCFANAFGFIPKREFLFLVFFFLLLTVLFALLLLSERVQKRWKYS